MRFVVGRYGLDRGSFIIDIGIKDHFGHRVFWALSYGAGNWV
jgi:hypothetical protein